MNSMMLKELHDKWLAQKPEGASHEEDACPVCSGEISEETPKGGSVTKSYTEDEFKAAVEAATAELATKVKELESVQIASETEAKVGEVRAEMETKISELQAQLDTAVLEASEAKKAHDELVAFLDEEKAKAEAAAEIAARRDERIAKVKEVANFPEERIAARADEWAALSDEVFESLLEDWKAVASSETKKEESKKEEIPSKTALTASNENKGGTENVMREVLSLRFKGIDTRKSL